MPKLLKLLILYYSQTGNTEKMARAVEARVKSVASVNVELKYFARPEVAVKGDYLKGKAGAAFGSYGWSGGSPMLQEVMKKQVGDGNHRAFSVNKTHSRQKGLEECRKLGKTVAERIVKASLSS